MRIGLRLQGMALDEKFSLHVHMICGIRRRMLITKPDGTVKLIIFEREGDDLVLVGPEADDDDDLCFRVILPEPLPLAA